MTLLVGLDALSIFLGSLAIFLGTTPLIFVSLPRFLLLAALFVVLAFLLVVGAFFLLDLVALLAVVLAFLLVVGSLASVLVSAFFLFFGALLSSRLFGADRLENLRPLGRLLLVAFSVLDAVTLVVGSSRFGLTRRSFAIGIERVLLRFDPAAFGVLLHTLVLLTSTLVVDLAPLRLELTSRCLVTPEVSLASSLALLGIVPLLGISFVSGGR